jgi:hypothetical protein
MAANHPVIAPRGLIWISAAVGWVMLILLVGTFTAPYALLSAALGSPFVAVPALAYFIVVTVVTRRRILSLRLVIALTFVGWVLSVLAGTFMVSAVFRLPSPIGTDWDPFVIWALTFSPTVAVALVVSVILQVVHGRRAAAQNVSLCG